MPPSKNALSRNFSREASGLLTQVGHGRLLVIGDSSLDIPDTARVIYYLGNKEGDISGAAALQEIEAAYPLDKHVPIRFMMPDEGDKNQHTAPNRNRTTIEALGFSAVGLIKDGPEGFYELSKGTDHTKPPIYCLTASDFAYDCIAATLGHSQV